MKKNTYNEQQLLDIITNITTSSSDKLQKLTFSKSRTCDILNIYAKPFNSKGLIIIQFESREKSGKALHKNIAIEDCPSHILSLITGSFSQLNISTEEKDYQIISKRGSFISLETTKNTVVKSEISSHNKNKNYYFSDKKITPFLIGLGIMTKDGVVKQNQYDKFRQINKFLEYIDKTKFNFDTSKPIHIIDFCCGKGYLTFATYAYLKEVCGLDVIITGIDLKSDVVENCNALAKSLGFTSLSFLCMDINDYTVPNCDLVISLHACNTATDIVLYKAIKCGAKAILSSPCCHHELATQLENEDISFITSFPILHQRFCEMLTDSIRANTLKAYGYNVNVTEFIDLEGTGKNILINAIYKGIPDDFDNHVDTVKAYCFKYNVTPTLLKKLNIL